MATDGAETERERIQTYVPAYQREEWEAHADELDMSLSEFVRSMVQAGRRGFADSVEENGGEGASSDDDPRGRGVEAQVLDLLDEEPREWDELLDALTTDVEDRLEETLRELQERNEVRYSGRDGGYRLE